MSKKIGLSLVVAMAQNGVIGRENGLPWHLPKDLAYFKQITMGHPIIMGRKTFESIGRPLPGRTNIVVTRQKSWASDGVEKVDSVSAAIDLAEVIAHSDSLSEYMLIGGASLYGQVLGSAAKIYMTEVCAEIEGDTKFPEFDKSQWREVSRENHSADAHNPYDYSFVVYERNANNEYPITG